MRRATRFSGKWLEFKTDLEDLIDDFNRPDGDPRKKYFEHVHVAVAWRVSDVPDPYDVRLFDELSWPERRFFGTTHQLRLGDGAHVAEVMELRRVLPILLASEEST
jgi:hypothetical protein